MKPVHRLSSLLTLKYCPLPPTFPTNLPHSFRSRPEPLQLPWLHELRYGGPRFDCLND